MHGPIDPDARLTLEQLEADLRAADSSTLLLPAWLLRKIVTHDRGPAAAVFAVPRAQAHVIARERLLEIAGREELLPDVTPPPTPTVTLLARPEPEVLASTKAEDLLRRYWRMLFHARARAAVAAAIDAGPGSRAAATQRRVERMGRPAFNEARFVLHRERYLPAYADDTEAYAEFAALFLDLTCFAPEPLPYFFPAIAEPAPVLALICGDVDCDALLRGTRPPNCADAQAAHAAPPADDRAASNGRPRRVRRDAAHRERLLAAADRADAVRNDVRAAIWRMRVYRAGAGANGAGARDGSSGVYADALRDLDQLTARLKAALGLGDAPARQWRAWLAALLENAAGGWWNADGRLLYDLQKACVYHEREIYSVNVVEYLLDFGRRPLRRPQPGQRIVLTLKALRSARRRTDRSGLSPHGRAQLRRLLDSAVGHVEGRLREFLRPAITGALDDGGLRPAGATETVARAKLTEELLDTITETGYLTFPTLRDAVSQNQMKLNDLGATPSADARPPLAHAPTPLLRATASTRVGEGFGGGRPDDEKSDGDASPAAPIPQAPPPRRRGDQLLRVDRRLEDKLDFVYRRAEIYLRGFHRLSSVFFATAVGRLVTKWVILPLGGAYIALEALDHTVGLLIHKLAADKNTVVQAVGSSAGHALAPTVTTGGAAAATAETTKHHPIFNQTWLLLLLGVFLLGVINVPAFRRAVGVTLKRFFRALGVIFVDAPRWVFDRPIVRAFLDSQFVRLLGRYVFKPLLVAGFVYLFVPRDASGNTTVAVIVGGFLLGNFLLNSRTGRAVEQAVLHSIRTTFARLTWDVLATVVRQVILIFQRLLEAFDRLLYAVDEMLRFRNGERKSTIVLKAILGVFWFYVAYATRFVINLLVEPQINPIKHFPVVTVSHKMILPLAPMLKDALVSLGVESGRAYASAGLIVTGTPGIFGFLAWEFRGNWKLYRANNSAALKPVRVGSHGETVATFLRPGFHSGTVPKIFHRLRKAARRSAAPLPDDHKHLHAAHHVEEALAAFVDREFLALLNNHPLFRDAPITRGHIHVAATLIRIELHAPPTSPSPHLPITSHSLPTSALTICFEQRTGWLLAGIDRPGFAGRLSPDQSRQFAAALAGLYKLAGVDMVREQIESHFPEGTRFELRKNDLIVWPGGDFGVEGAYDLSADGPDVRPRVIQGGAVLPTLRFEQLLFNKVDLSRAAWNDAWDRAATAGTFPGLRVLPDVGAGTDVAVGVRRELVPAEG